MNKFTFLIASTAVLALTIAALQSQRLHKLKADNAALSEKYAQVPERQASIQAVPSELGPGMAVDTAELKRLREQQGELLRLRARFAALKAAGVGPASAAQGSDDQAERSEKPVEPSPEQSEAMLPKHLFNSAKLLGALARIQSTYSNDQLPTNFDQIRALLPAALPGKTELERFEFLDHGRSLTLAEPSIILIRERAPRQQPDGSWARVYVMTDGSTVEHRGISPDFQAYERQFLPAERQ